MNWIIGLLVVIVLALAAVTVWVRARPVPPAALAFPDMPASVGDYPSAGGFAAVRASSDPLAAFDRIADIVAATDRTRIVSQDVDRLVAVTRSRVFGFPDVAHVWINDGTLAVRSHLVIGQSDLGVNAKRVNSWLEQAGL